MAAKMSLALQAAVEQGIAYTDKIVACEKCKFFTTTGPSDAWEHVCTLHELTLGLRSVTATGRCNFFLKRPTGLDEAVAAARGSEPPTPKTGYA